MNTQRFLEIDVLRTVAIALMVLYHLAFDLQWYYGWNIDMTEGFWWLIGRTSAVLFLLLVGASFIVASRYKSAKTIWMRSLQRGCIVLGIAAGISAATYMLDADTYIRFGILHCIGVSILLLPAFLRLKEWSACVGIIFILVGLQMETILRNTSLLLPLGIRYPGFQTLDYFPLLPWFGVVLLGMGIGYLIYIDCRRQPMPISKKWRKLTLPGRHSLILYLIHQPILVGLLYLFYQV